MMSKTRILILALVVVLVVTVAIAVPRLQEQRNIADSVIESTY